MGVTSRSVRNGSGGEAGSYDVKIRTASAAHEQVTGEPSSVGGLAARGRRARIWSSLAVWMTNCRLWPSSDTPSSVPVTELTGVPDAGAEAPGGAAAVTATDSGLMAAVTSAAPEAGTLPLVGRVERSERPAVRTLTPELSKDEIAP